MEAKKHLRDQIEVEIAEVLVRRNIARTKAVAQVMEYYDGISTLSIE